MRGRYSLSMTNKGSSWPGLESGFLWALQWISYSASSSSSSMPCLAPPSSPEEASVHYCATSKMVRIFKVSAPLYYILTVKGFHFKYDSGLSGCVCIPKLWGSLKKCIQSSQIHSVLSIKSGFFLRFPRAAFFSPPLLVLSPSPTNLHADSLEAHFLNLQKTLGIICIPDPLVWQYAVCFS